MQLLETPPAITATLLPPPDKRNQYFTSLLLKKGKQHTSKAITIYRVRISSWILN